MNTKLKKIIFSLIVFCLVLGTGAIINIGNFQKLEGYMYSLAASIETSATSSNATSSNATSSNATSSNATSSNATSSKATSIKLNKTSLTFEGIGTWTLIATVSPTSATNKTVTWKSSDPEVAAGWIQSIY
jgi:uncharacterized protein YjdB